MKTIIQHLILRQKRYIALALLLFITYISYYNFRHDLKIFLDPLLVTGILAYIVVLLLLDKVQNEFSSTIDRLTNSGVFVMSPDDKKRFLKILSMGKRKWSIITALFFSVSILISFLYAFHDARLPPFLTTLEVVLAFISGIYFGEIMIYGQFGDIVKRSIKVNLTIDHPDQAQGLSPIGKFYSYLIATISIPILFVSIWAFIIPNFQSYSNWLMPYLGLLVIALLYFFFIVIKPIYEFHRMMLNNNNIKLKEIDQISLSFIKLAQKEKDFTVGESGENIESIKGNLQNRYITIINAPSWPFKFTFISFFFSSVVINIVSLLGGMVTILQSIN